MESGISATKETYSESNDAFASHGTQARRRPVGRQPNPCIEAKTVAAATAGVIRKTFPKLKEKFARLPDPRRQDMCRYSGEHIWWSGLLMFLTRAGSRNAFDQARNSGTMPDNMGSFCGQTSDDFRFEGQPLITCSDNLTHHLNRVDAENTQNIPAELCQELLTKRMFDGARLLDSWYILVFDGTVQERCRKGFEDGGKSGSGGARYRYVLQCSILGPDGTIFPMIHEHVDMHTPETEKEDCELKAFFRLSGRLKKKFPRLRFCIVGDALYCVESVADVCVRNSWKYVLTLKEGRQPCLWDELLELLPLSFGNRLRVWTGQDGSSGLRDFRWVEDLPMGKHRITAVLSGEFVGSEGTLYAYATNLLVNRDRVLAIVASSGRERHRIEDYFNAGKNHGIGLEHVFCASSNASKNFYTLMQIAAILWTITCHGYLMRTFAWAAHATETALARAIAEGMRAGLFPQQLPAPGQLRFLT